MYSLDLPCQLCHRAASSRSISVFRYTCSIRKRTWIFFGYRNKTRISNPLIRLWNAESDGLSFPLFKRQDLEITVACVRLVSFNVFQEQHHHITVGAKIDLV